MLTGIKNMVDLCKYFLESDMCKPKVYEIEFKLIKSQHSLQFYGFDVQLN